MVWEGLLVYAVTDLFLPLGEVTSGFSYSTSACGPLCMSLENRLYVDIEMGEKEPGKV